MSLPKIDYSMVNIKVPSLNKNYKFRPFLVKEEKLLLMARESENSEDILLAIKQVVNNCVLDKLDIDKLAVFDLEYIFLKLRSISVDNIVTLSYTDLEDKKPYEFKINLDDVKVIYPEKIDNNIKINSKSGIVMSYPSASLYEDKEFLTLKKDYLFELIIKCLDKLYIEDNVYEFKNYKKQEIVEFLEGLNLKLFEQIQNFLLNVPKLNYEIKYTNSLGNDRSIVLNSLNDFFTWR